MSEDGGGVEGGEVDTGIEMRAVAEDVKGTDGEQAVEGGEGTTKFGEKDEGIGR